MEIEAHVVGLWDSHGDGKKMLPIEMERNVMGLPQGCKRNVEMKMLLL